MARVARCAGALFGWGPNRALSGSGLTTAPVLVSVRSPPFAFLLALRSGGEQRRGSAKIVRRGKQPSSITNSSPEQAGDAFEGAPLRFAECPSSPFLRRCYIGDISGLRRFATVIAVRRSICGPNGRADRSGK
jgi:hypothetical protein